MVARSRFFLFVFCAVAAGVFLYSCQRPRPLSAEDMAGVWRVDRSFAPNYANPPLPEGYYDATLTLNPDGSFVAGSLPPDFFQTALHTFKAPEYHGTWTVQWAGKAYSLGLKFANSENYFSTLVEKRTGKHAILMDRDSEHPAFYMTRPDAP